MNEHAPADQDDLDWQHEQQRDLELLELAAIDALKASRTRPLTLEEQMTLAHLSGVASSYYKEVRQ